MRKKTCHIELINASRCLRTHACWNGWRGRHFATEVLGKEGCSSVFGALYLPSRPSRNIQIMGYSSGDPSESYSRRMIQANGILADGFSRVLSGPISTRSTSASAFQLSFCRSCIDTASKNLNEQTQNPALSSSALLPAHS